MDIPKINRLGWGLGPEQVFENNWGNTEALTCVACGMVRDLELDCRLCLHVTAHRRQCAYRM